MPLMVSGLNPALWMALSTRIADYVLFAISRNHPEGSQNLKHFRLVTDCAPQGSSRTTFTSFITILHPSKSYLNSVIVNPSLQKLFSFFLMNRMQLKCNKFPTLAVLLSLSAQKEVLNLAALKC